MPAMQIDLHADTPLLMHWVGYAFVRRHRTWLPRSAWMSHVDLPRMREASLDAQLFGLVSLPVEGDPINTIHSLIDRVEAAALRSNGRFEIVRTVAELRAARARGAYAGLLSIEGVHPLGGRIERADALIDRGVISFGLAHFHANEACYPAVGIGMRSDAGLTHFGHQLVEHLETRNVLLDLTHINRVGFFDALEHFDGGVLVSHTGVEGAHRHWRNLDDEQVRAIADHGGVIGVIFSRGFLGGSGIDAVVRHIRHIVDVGGESVAALGSDFDGFVVPVRGLRDITGLPALRETLSRAGLQARVVDGVMGDNALRMIEEARG